MNTNKIRFIKRVIFTDMNGAVRKIYEIGDTETFHGKTNHYFITGMGGIYFDEAEEVVDYSKYY